MKVDRNTTQDNAVFITRKLIEYRNSHEPINNIGSFTYFTIGLFTLLAERSLRSTLK